MEKHPRGRQSAETAEQTRRTILVAALHIFASLGFEATAMRDIALAAGTTHSLIRHHFGSKEGVWQAVVNAAFKEITSELNATVDTSSNDPATIIKGIVRAFLEVCARSPEIVQLLLHEGTKQSARLEYVMKQAIQLQDMIDPLLPRAQSDGELQQFNSRSLALYILTAGAAPFGLFALSNQIIQTNILSQEQAEQHIERVIQTLFPTAQSTYPIQEV